MTTSDFRIIEKISYPVRPTLSCINPNAGASLTWVNSSRTGWP